MEARWRCADVKGMKLLMLVGGIPTWKHEALDACYKCRDIEAEKLWRLAGDVLQVWRYRNYGAIKLWRRAIGVAIL